MSELTYKWNNQDNELDEYKDGEYTTCHSEQEIADEMNDYRKALTNSNNKVDDLERQLKEDRRDHLKDTRELLRQLAEARDEVDYAINFFSKNEQFGVVGILKGIKNKLKEQGDE